MSAILDVDGEEKHYAVTLLAHFKDSYTNTLLLLDQAGKLDFEFTEDGILLSERGYSPEEVVNSSQTQDAKPSKNMWTKMKGKNCDFEVTAGKITAFESKPTQLAINEVETRGNEQIALIQEQSSETRTIARQQLEEDLAIIKSRGQLAVATNKAANDRALSVKTTDICMSQEESRREHAKFLLDLSDRSAAQERQTTKLEADLKESLEILREELDHELACTAEKNRTLEAKVQLDRMREKALEELELEETLKHLAHKHGKKTALIEAVAKSEELSAHHKAQAAFTKHTEEHSTNVARLNQRGKEVDLEELKQNTEFRTAERIAQLDRLIRQFQSIDSSRSHQRAMEPRSVRCQNSIF